MNRARSVAALLVTAVLVVLQALVTAQVAQARQPDDDAAVRGYGSCLKGQRAGDLLLLIDESGSLRDSDPQKARISAATYLLTQLATQTDRVGITLQVQVAGFATVFDPGAGPWTPLNPDTLPELTRAVQAFAERDDGDDTDYWTALEGARRSLADQALAAGAGEAGRCQAIAWFSDGRLDLEPRATPDRQQAFGTAVPYAPGVDLSTEDGAARAEAAATTSLCREGGLADQLRTANVVTFGVGLVPQGVPPTDFDLMRAIATGGPFQGAPCGAISDPAPGTFRSASDLDALLLAFDALLGPPDVPTLPSDICAPADTTCKGHEFVLDESIDGLHVLGQVEGNPNVLAELIGPDGTVHQLSGKDVGAVTPLAFGPVTGSYSWQSEQTVVIDLANETRAAPGWAGLWAVRFVDPNATSSSGESRTNIRIWGNVLPAWTNRVDAAPSESTVDVRLGLQKAGGQDVPPDSLSGTIDAAVVLLSPDGSTLPVAAGLDKQAMANPVTLDLARVPPGQATLRLTLDLTTAPATRPGTGEQVPGTPLSTQVVDIPLTVESPLGYPTVASRVDFGVIEGTPQLAAPLAVTGPGCVWVPAGAPLTLTTTPDGVSNPVITAGGVSSAPSCLRVAEGESAQLMLQLSADQPGNGALTGTLPVSIAPLDRPDDVRTVDVTFVADLRTPVDPLNFLAALLAALLLGPGIPLGLLYLVKWLAARIPARGLFAQRIPVLVDGDRVLRDGVPFGFRQQDFNDLVPIPRGGARRLDAAGVALRARIGWSPFGAGYVSVEPPLPFVCVSSTDAEPHGERMAARLPLAVHNTWVVLHDPTGPPDAAQVLVLVGSESTAQQREQLATTIDTELPQLLRRLRAALAERGGHPGDAGPPPVPAPVGPGSFGPQPSYGPPSGYSPPAGSGQPAYGPPSGSGGAWGGGADTAYGPPGDERTARQDRTTPSYGPPADESTVQQDRTAPSYGPPGDERTTRQDRTTPSYGPPGDEQTRPDRTTSYVPPAGGATYGPHGTATYGPDAEAGWGPGPDDPTDDQDRRPGQQPIWPPYDRRS